LAVLYFIIGVFNVILGLALAALDVAFFLAGLGVLFGTILFIIGLLDLVVGWGLWTLQSWARMAAIVLAVIGLLAFPIGTIISIIILWYLFKPEVKAAFGVPTYAPVGPMGTGTRTCPQCGQTIDASYNACPHCGYVIPRAPAPQPAAAPPPPAPVQPAAGSPAGSRRFCSSCGAAVTANQTFCSNCGAKL
jgi:RNA polymerase subunit RPABC4/transcription elongation factor Spt4